MELLDLLSNRQKQMSRFRRVALHVHSPLSECWACSEGSRQDLLNDPSPYLKCLVENYDLVAITDHMRVGFACSHCGRNADCTVLPGVELNVRLESPFESLRIHFVAIFPSPDKIERIFAGQSHIPAESERNSGHEMRVKSLEDLVQAVQREDGIVVAAHVDNGLRSEFKDMGDGALQLSYGDDATEMDPKARKLCDEFKEALVRAKVNAVEVHSVRDVPHYRFTLGGDRREIATVLSNDSHSLSELRSRPCTYIKMTEVSLNGLRQALRFPDTRVRHTEPASTLPHILGMRIAGSRGSMSDLVVAFSPNLSCIIGARGTGKSALVDAMRYVFGYNRGMGGHIGTELSKQVSDRQRETLDGASVELLYQTASGEIVRMQSEYSGDEPYSTRVYDADGNDTQIEDVETAGSFPCRLYGWSEIEHLVLSKVNYAP